ncbi:hypothetical protein M9Y10_045828 [Tritrichomonas musculus]|uniref:Helicase/UvrB N-terminal domain-containing protein n=1 Tax=Tritrichomonas musculus TaxID=1915356 RepID=A0ABR2JWI3_9EUKA
MMNFDLSLKDTSDKFPKINDLVEECRKLTNSPNYFQILIKLIDSLKTLASIFSKNSDFLNNELIYDDIIQVFHTINTISDILIQYLRYISSSPKEDDPIIGSNISDLHDCIQIFTTNFQQIIDQHSNNNTEKVDILYNWIGLECSLFLFCINVKSVPEFPYCELKIVTFYKNCEKLDSIQNTVTAVTSFCGTGKITCVPIIMLIKSLKEGMKIPFCVLSKTNSKIVENLMNFFRGKISKNVTITTDKNEFSELFKNYDQNLKKLVFGIFTPYDILSFLFENQENEKNFHFYRFIVDEIQHRSAITDVLIARLSNTQFHRRSS